jgi:formylmethanofuran dehydrogenase subunit B
MKMSSSTLDGKPIPLDEAYRHAAQLLSAARFPVVAGLGADVNGARAAVLLAERLRGAFDHMGAPAALRDLEVMRSFGQFTTTANEARVRADTLVFIGPGLAAQWPTMFERLALDKPPRLGREGARKILWIGAKRGEAKIDGVEIETLSVTADEIPGVLGALRARLGGRPIATSDAAIKKFDAHAATLKSAKFGVAVWSAATLDSLSIEMAQGLLQDLNLTTRFTAVPLTGGDGAAGVIAASGWMTGFPPRTGFGRGYPEHDPWRFDSTRLVDSGESDAALWISAYGDRAPPWERDDLPLVTLSPAGAATKRGLWIGVGRPGVESDAIDYSQDAATLVYRKASAKSDAPSVAEAVKAIHTSIPEEAPC